jgi:hypothetical protein
MLEETDPRITYDYTMAGAHAFKALGTPARPLRFVFMSGMSVTQAQPGMFTPLFSRVKGEAERALRAMETEAFKTVFVRPGGILPTPEVSSFLAASSPSTRPTCPS